MTNEDDFVEKLLRDLPKAPPMNDLEIKRFEKHVDSLVEAENKQKISKGWGSKLTVAASIVALVAGVAIFADSSKIINPQKSPIAAPSSSSTGATGQNGASNEDLDVPQSNGNDSSETPETGTTTYGNSQSPNPGNSKGSIPVLNFGFDYEVDEKSARTKVKADARLGDTKLMKSSQIACSVKLDVDNKLWAIDKGTYAGEDIEAYYYGSSISALSIKIIGFGCELLKDL
jgi:hypothetical protein